MKKLLIIVISSFILAACSQDFARTTKNETKDNTPGQTKQAFVPGTEDIPVYNGFQAVANSAVSYDTTDGRILDAEFFNDSAEIEDVRNFYNNTLPQLGWSTTNYQVYERDGETLKVNIAQHNNKIVLKFNIRPTRPTLPFS